MLNTKNILNQIADVMNKWNGIIVGGAPADCYFNKTISDVDVIIPNNECSFYNVMKGLGRKI